MNSIATPDFELPVSVTATTLPWESVTDWAALGQGLVAGAWSVVAELEGESCFYLVLRGNGPDARAARAFNEREREVLRRVALGQSNKLISYELDISETSVSSCLKDSRSKSGVRCRAKLVQLTQLGSIAPSEGRAEGFFVAEDESVVLRVEPRHAAAPDVLTASERFVFLAILGGLSNEEIGRRRGRSARTVANQVASIFYKLVVGSRAEIVAQHGGFSGVFRRRLDPRQSAPVTLPSASRCALRAPSTGNRMATDGALRACSGLPANSHSGAERDARDERDERDRPAACRLARALAL